MEECSAISAPHVIIIAGPNGAGKSTTAPVLLRDTLAVDEFVNADTLAQGLSAFSPEKVAVQADASCWKGWMNLQENGQALPLKQRLLRGHSPLGWNLCKRWVIKPIFFFCPCPVRKLPYKGWLHG